MQKVLNFLVKYRYILALVLRIGLVLVNELIDNYFNRNITDIDYHVVSDGARHVFSSPDGPYKRETYRYSPLLAYLMLPNIYLYYEFAKIVLCIIDVFIGKLIEILLDIQEPTNQNDSDIRKHQIISLLYLLNPMTVYICARGSSDCIITFLVILTIILIERDSYILGGIIFGLSIHLKIYPIIYYPSFYLYIGYKNLKNEDENDKSNQNFFMKIIISILNFITRMKKVFYNLFNVKSIVFVLVSITTFYVLFVGFYLLYGRIFVYETYLYHFVRKDHRHNYSLYFYMIYLSYASITSKIFSYIAFFPQFFLVLFSSLKLFTKINFCLVVQTIVFVTFNKVVTAQYFVWYMSLLPLIAKHNDLFIGKKLYGLFLISVWVFLEILWAVYANVVEHKGRNSFLEIWFTCIGFFLTNCFILQQLIKYQK
jgi:phosphatidylinositol glycan class M